MADETRNSQLPDDEPQVFAVSKENGGEWRFNRRDFVKAAGVTVATGALAGCSSDELLPTPMPTANPTALMPTEVAAPLQPSPVPKTDWGYAHEGWVLSAVISSDGTRLASSGDQTIKLWSLPDGALLNTLEGYLNAGSPISSVAISPDGNLLASAGGDFVAPLTLWSLPEGTLLQSLEGGSKSVAISPDGTLLASGGDRITTLWSLPGGELFKTLKYHTDIVLAVAFSPDGSLLASGGTGNTINLWSLPEGTLLHTLEGHSGHVNSVAISPDGALLVAGSGDMTIELWSLSEGIHLHTLKGHSNPVMSVAISPDGSLLVSGGADKTIKLWGLPDGEYVMDLIDISASTTNFEGIQYSPDDTGEGVITLPCGSPIPAGTTCICNCVQGSSCSCAGHTSSSGGGHYWYPN